MQKKFDLIDYAFEMVDTSFLMSAKKIKKFLQKKVLLIDYAFKDR